MDDAKMKTPSEKAREAKQTYMKEWRKKHPEKMREYRERYWAKKFDEMEKEVAGKDGKCKN